MPLELRDVRLTGRTPAGHPLTNEIDLWLSNITLSDDPTIRIEQVKSLVIVALSRGGLL